VGEVAPSPADSRPLRRSPFSRRAFGYRKDIANTARKQVGLDALSRLNEQSFNTNGNNGDADTDGDDAK